MGRNAYQRLIVALDYDRTRPAYEMAVKLAPFVGMFKIGSQLFTAEGPEAVQKIASVGKGIFLDLKFHDIPNTVVGAVAAAARLPGVQLLDLHGLGGLQMMQAAEAAMAGKSKPKLLAVTILTSMDSTALDQVGLGRDPGTVAVRLARLARRAGLDGVVASADAVPPIRRACGDDFLIVVPGIRLGTGPSQDQARTATPARAIQAGANYLVVGRPITGAVDPITAAKNIAGEIDQALKAPRGRPKSRKAFATP